LTRKKKIFLKKKRKEKCKTKWLLRKKKKKRKWSQSLVTFTGRQENGYRL